MLLAVLVALMCSCNGNKFKVSGTVEGAGDTTTLYLETTINGNWLFVDSVKTSAGKFAFTEDAAEYPNIYRLGYRDKNIYFPIDSIDNIEIKTSLAKFDEDYTLSGSDNAVKVMNIDKQAAKFSKAGDTSSDAYKKWKEQLSRDLVKDPASIVSFYLINKYIGNQPLFDPIDNRDFKIIGAVTNAFANFRPNDPRTTYMVDNFKQGLSQRRSMSTASRDTIVATQALLIDVKLQDKKGKKSRPSAGRDYDPRLKSGSEIRQLHLVVSRRQIEGREHIICLYQPGRLAVNLSLPAVNIRNSQAKQPASVKMDRA